MRAASLSLLILTGILLVLVLSILLYRPHRIASPVMRRRKKESQDTGIADLFREDLAESERMIRLRWPYSTWMMQFIPLKESLLMHWQGLARQPEQSVLFYAGTERTLQMIMEAVSRLNSDHDQPAYDLWIALPAGYENQYYSSAEVRRYFLDGGMAVKCVYCDGDGMEQLFSDTPDTAVVSFGTKAMAEFKIEGEATHIPAYRQAISGASLAAPRFTETSRRSLKQLKERLPWRMQVYDALPFSDEKKIRKFCALFPFMNGWFDTELCFCEDTFILQAVNEEQKEEAIGTLRTMAEKYGVSLKLKAERNTSSFDPDSPECRSYLSLVKDTMEPDYILTVLRNDIYTPHVSGLPAVFFSPMRSLMRDSAAKAVSYYYEIMMSGPKKER